MIIPVIDTHCDLVVPYQELKELFNKKVQGAQTNLPLLKEANVKVIFAGFSYDDLLKNSDEQFNDLLEMIKIYSDEFELITDFSQIDKILKSKKIGVILHIEGAAILNNDINNLITLYNRGLRSLGLTHNTENCLATGALVNNEKGLTEFGREVIKKCNELKIAVDLAHLNEKGFYEVVKLSKVPPFISHGNCYSITPNPRNFKDEQLKEIAHLGSVVGIFFSGKFLNPQQDGKKAHINDAILHLNHMVKIMGINHVAIGSDFGGITTGLPKGLENHSKLKKLFSLLSKEGYKNDDIEKMAYKNILRYLKENYV